VKDPYKTLGVARDASHQEIKRAYRAKAKKDHPDAGGRESEMAELTGAYALLSSPERRKNYDETGEDRQRDRTGLVMQKVAQMAAAVFFEQAGRRVDGFLAEYEARWKQRYEDDKAEGAKRRALIEAAQARLVKRPERDAIGDFLESHLASIERTLRTLEEQNEIELEALAVMRSYKYKEPPAVISTVYYTLGGFGG
jgi:curved DNA-binding protein CbpA